MKGVLCVYGHQSYLFAFENKSKNVGLQNKFQKLFQAKQTNFCQRIPHNPYLSKLRQETYILPSI